MAVNYYQLVGGSKRLNEVVFAGSHDAGISSGKWFVKTQSLNIGDQAAAGVRIFDLRIAATTVSGKVDGVKKAELKAYHGGLSSKTGRGRDMGPALGQRVIERFKAKPGTKFGSGLDEMLGQAKSFVTNSTEFLLLKFDHCHNWSLIAEACCSVLGNSIYTGGGNLNNKTLDELKGKVIVLFSPDGLAVARQAGFDHTDGILGIVNLSSAGRGAYDPNYNGLQYIGKGGTSALNMKTKSGKIKENLKKQRKRLAAAHGEDPDIMGMVYWTTTGALGSIKRRNDKMWHDRNKPKMKELWYSSVWSAVTDRLQTDLQPYSVAAGTRIKMFLPNFVMIDFADPSKCDTIAELNTLAANSLSNLYDIATEPD
jgi:hypothetical protein